MTKFMFVLCIIFILLALTVPVMLEEYINAKSSGIGIDARLNGNDEEYAGATFMVKYMSTLVNLFRFIFSGLSLLFLYLAIRKHIKKF